jgi:hypothetical protein
MQRRKPPGVVKACACASHPETECDTALNMTDPIAKMWAVRQQTFGGLHLPAQAVADKVLKK